MEKLTGQSWFSFPDDLNVVYVVADYLEVPALISTTILYVNTLRRDRTFKSVLYIILLNTQWLHILWITDSFVVQSFSLNGMFSWDASVAWIAILIDFLEVPVIIEMLKQIYDQRGEIVRRMRARFVRASAALGTDGTREGAQSRNSSSAR
jgi:hypothetical protein